MLRLAIEGELAQFRSKLIRVRGLLQKQVDDQDITWMNEDISGICLLKCWWLKSFCASHILLHHKSIKVYWSYGKWMIHVHIILCTTFINWSVLYYDILTLSYKVDMLDKLIWCKIPSQNHLGWLGDELAASDLWIWRSWVAVQRFFVQGKSEVIPGHVMWCVEMISWPVSHLAVETQWRHLHSLVLASGR